MITSLNNFTGITLETDIAVITLKDNLTHTYFSKLSWEKDNGMPMGIGKITTLYDESIEKYWGTYSGTVVLHANLNNDKNKKSLIKKTKKMKSKIVSKKTKNNKIRLQNDVYNYSFIGKVHRCKQTGKTFNIYLEDLGWKFLQKVPQQFRQSYIAGQPLDKAFQAICEFMGIDFAYSIDDLSKYNFSTDGYSIEKDGTIIEDTPNILEEFNTMNTTDEDNKTTTDENMGRDLYSQSFESSGLIENKNEKNENKSNIEKDVQSIDKALNQLTTNSNNKSDTKLTENNSTKEQYQEEFDRKIEDLFKGNTLYDSNISDSILNYNWITIQPIVPQTTSTISSTNSAGATSENSKSSNNENNEESQSTPSSPSNQNEEKGLGKTAAGSYYLTQDAINNMSMAEAKNHYDYGKAHEPYYTRATMEKLFYRMMFGTKFY